MVSKTRFFEPAPVAFHSSQYASFTLSNLAACAFTSGSKDEMEDAFELARSCLLTLLESTDMEPCASSFTNFLLVVSRHLKAGVIRDQIAEAVFREGCKRGKIDKKTLYAFQKASPSVSYQILSGQRILPAEWQRNIISDATTNVNS